MFKIGREQQRGVFALSIEISWFNQPFSAFGFSMGRAIARTGCALSLRNRVTDQFGEIFLTFRLAKTAQKLLVAEIRQDSTSCCFTVNQL